MREALIERNTKETNIRIKLKLEGGGEARINTGIGFFDHMLEAMARFGYLDLEVEAQGDLLVDAHHTIEDCGIVLGQALREALGDRRGIERVADTLLPMDEALVQVALDLSNRPYLVWEADSSEGMVGGFPVEMAEEFFRAVAVQAGLTLHMRQISGKNRHHILEALFKGFGRALGLAVRENQRFQGVLSTKGVL
ncbi:imidazoleglycerol-phosphate dehydratase [Desulfitobacterium dichloroeliminans LMG P-21439]|uniref:Imidazoleglycerol-phosphate dehydratase n=1 Tax=Desulfitobacterium dichloroeliminans (strain LMG P-21439 / DCA1) TaxID=871963 RepID=L0F4I4_DESDL|nr:imidazoleglycerol-phosphate dehydratase HisB [Desulfitobacterium dichloroeliminans]AGA68749.1 imidazoleglycerol-phosphate dehydratase [Desulfitobacterium dichloroeliminans LMG P-21439]